MSALIRTWQDDNGRVCAVISRWINKRDRECRYAFSLLYRESIARWFPSWSSGQITVVIFSGNFLSRNHWDAIRLWPKWLDRSEMKPLARILIFPAFELFLWQRPSTSAIAFSAFSWSFCYYGRIGMSFLVEDKFFFMTKRFLVYFLITFIASYDKMHCSCLQNFWYAKND